MNYAAPFTFDFKQDERKIHTKPRALGAPFVAALLESRIRKAARHLAQRQEMIEAVKTYRRDER
jgi:hypothetical protein